MFVNMYDELMAIEVKVYPMVRTAPFSASYYISIKCTTGCKVMYWNSEMKGLK
jgi:hypothetical protein